jgi:hypothetical protein
VLRISPQYWSQAACGSRGALEDSRISLGTSRYFFHDESIDNLSPDNASIDNESPDNVSPDNLSTVQI